MSKFSSFFRRNTTTIAIVIMVVAFGTILFLQAVATGKLQEQTKQQQQIILQIKSVTDQIATAATQRTQQIDAINKHLDCIVQFFAAQDRANQTIADINTCTLANTKTGQTTPLTSPSNPTNSDNGPQTDNSSNSPSSTLSVSTPEAAQPSFLDRLVINPIKSIINAL